MLVMMSHISCVYNTFFVYCVSFSLMTSLTTMGLGLGLGLGPGHIVLAIYQFAVVKW